MGATLIGDSEFRAWADATVDRYAREEPSRDNSHLSPVARVVSHPIVFDFAQRVTAGGLKPVFGLIDRWLGDGPRSRTLDICCGTGNLADLARGEYLGVDLDPGSIVRARRKYRRDPSKRFVVADVTKLDLKPRSFDVVLFINGMHHLPDELAVTILKALAVAASGPIIIADPALETSSLMSNVLFMLEQGHHLRPRSAQHSLLKEAGLVIERDETLYTGFAHQRVMLCRNRH
jgi:SAM-dependent methyltransferase